MEVVNMSSNLTEMSENQNVYIEEYVPKSVIYTMYGLCIVMILTGNLMVIAAVFLEPKLRQSPTNLLIVSLAMSDLLVGSYYIPSVIMWDEATHLMSNVIICNIDGFIVLTSTGASVFTLIAIAIDRFRAIVTPFKPKITCVQAGILVAVAWGCAMGYALYLPIIYEYQTEVTAIGNQTVSVSYCYLKPSHINSLKYFRTLDCVVLFFIPFMVLLCLYVPMVYKLWFGKQPVSTTGNKKRRAVKMLSMVVIIFFMMWLPYYSLYLFAQYGDIANTKINVRAYALIALCLNFSNSWINPIIYGCFNDNFRKAYKNAILCRICANSVRVFPSTSVHESEGSNPMRNGDQPAQPTRNTLLTTANTASMQTYMTPSVSHVTPAFFIPGTTGK